MFITFQAYILFLLYRFASTCPQFSQPQFSLVFSTELNLKYLLLYSFYCLGLGSEYKCTIEFSFSLLVLICFFFNPLRSSYEIDLVSCCYKLYLALSTNYLMTSVLVSFFNVLRICSGSLSQKTGFTRLLI